MTKAFDKIVSGIATLKMAALASLQARVRPVAAIFLLVAAIFFSVAFVEKTVAFIFWTIALAFCADAAAEIAAATPDFFQKWAFEAQNAGEGGRKGSGTAKIR